MASKYPGWSPYVYVLNNPLIFIDPDGRCSRPAGIQSGQIGICIESFIAGPSPGVPRWAADNRTFSADGGTYRTSDRFVINLATGEIQSDVKSVGKTGILPGYGRLRHGAEVKDDGTVVNATGYGKTLSPWPPFGIDYSFELTISKDGSVKLSDYAHDGFPSFEIWIYEDGKDPQLLYGYVEGGVLQLRPPKDVRKDEEDER